MFDNSQQIKVLNLKDQADQRSVMSREDGLDQCISLLLHLIWTHMQVGAREGERAMPSIITQNKIKLKKKKTQKKHHSLHMNTRQTLFTHILFDFMCHSRLYFSFNTSLMPQWIKIQSLLERNNTQNIQCILESPRLPVTVYKQVHRGGLRPRSNQMLPCLFRRFIWRLRRGK